MKYTAVIFDLDGVICSTDNYHYLAWKVLAEEEGIYFDREINHRLRGVSRMESLEIILERASRAYAGEEKAAMAERKNLIYNVLLEQMTPADLPGEVANVLHTLKQSDVKIAIGSSSKNARTILQRIGLDHAFDEISDGTNISHSKPNPEVFLKAAKMLGEQPEDCLVVEDAKAGIAAAVAGGFDSAGIGEAAEEEGVTYPLRAFRDLLGIVLG